MDLRPSLAARRDRRAPRRRGLSSRWRRASCAPLFGSTSISLTRAFDRSQPFADNVDAQIFFIARLPRVLAAALVGSALASAGVVFQALLRNPLATPFTLGISAGRRAGRDAGDHLRRRAGGRSMGQRAAGKLPRRHRRGDRRLPAGDGPPSGLLDQGHAAGGRDAQLVALRADSLRAVLRRHDARDADAAMAYGRPGCGQLPAAPRGAADAGGRLWASSRGCRGR